MSPWPLMCTLSSFNLLFSMLLFFKYSLLMSLLSSAILLSSSTLLWWGNYGMEFQFGSETMNLNSSLKFSMILFILSEVFFFISFFWAYFHFFLSPSGETGFMWPNSYINFFDPFSVPLVNTLVLLSSGVTVTICHSYLFFKNYNLSSWYLFFTFSLGMFFSFLQLKEYQSSFFSISDSNFGSSFFLLTGFHGLHVIVGSLFLLFCLFTLMKLKYTNNMMISMELSIWYWHFVDVVWLLLYYLVYYMLR